MLCLNILSQAARIELNTVLPQINLETTLPKVQISTEAAKVEISQPQGDLEIDQSPCRASLGIKSFYEFAMDNADRGRRTVLETIGRMSEEGDRLAAVEKEPNAIVNMAVEKTTVEDSDLEITWIENPNIHYQAQQPTFNPIPGNFDLQLQRGTVDNNFQWGKVTVGISQYQSIRFWTTENKWDMYV